MAEEGSKTTQHNGFTESIKKHTEDNKAHRKHRHSEGDEFTHTSTVLWKWVHLEDNPLVNAEYAD